MLIHNAEHTFYYIDPSLGSEDGDGASVATAAKHFPADMDVDNRIYLVRRTSIDTPANFTPHDSSSNKTYGNVKSFVVMGMPKSDDALFTQMPEDAKSAWVDADQDYAQVKMPGNGRYHVSYTACTNFFMFRVCFMNNKDNNYYDISSSNSNGCDIHLDHCWFRASAVDFTAEGGSASPSTNSGTRWLEFNEYIDNRAHNAKITNCRFDLWGADDGIRLGYVQNIYIENCEFHLSQSAMNQSAIKLSDDISMWCGEVYAKNLRGYYYFNDNRDSYVPGMISGCCKRALINTVTMDKGPNQNHNPYRGCCRISKMLRLSVYGAGSVIENVTVNAPDIVGDGSSIIYMKNYMSTDPNKRSMVSRGQYNVLRNITINFAESYDTPNLYHDLGSWTENIGNADYGLIELTNDKYGSYVRQCAADYLLQNIHINAPMGKAIYAWYTMFDMADCDVKGTIQACQSLGKIKSITTWRPGYAFFDNGVNTLYIGEIICNKSNPMWEYNGQEAVTSNYFSYILVGKTNTLCYPAKYNDNTAFDNDIYECNYICTNDRMDGAYMCRNAHSKAEAWSVYRQGSASTCSIRLTNEAKDDKKWPLVVGGAPFKGITQHVTQGDHTITFYLTMYGYNDCSAIKDKFHVIVETPSGEKFFSEEGNWALDEESVWENLEGNTSYKLTIPFHMEEEGDIVTSYTWSWYMIGAATFVDPFPTIQ